MIVADFASFAFLAVLFFLALRYAQGKLSKESQSGKALAYLFH